MKIFYFKRIFVTVLVTLFQFSVLMAENQPPAPRGSGGFGEDVVVGGNIDAYIPYLLLISIIYFGFIHYKYAKNNL